MKDNQKVYVIGHKNPDTDSICSAIAYADFKNRTDSGNFIAKRAGQINEETEFVLKYFGVKTPGYMPNAGMQVKEIEIHEVKGARSSISVRRAWERMKAEDIITLPITTPENELEGLITVNDIAESYMDASDNRIIATARTQYRSIAETVDGSVIVGDEEQYFEDGKVTVGAFHPDTMENYIEPHDLVILGNRTEDHLCAIEMNAGCIIVGLDAKISPMIKKLAEEMKCVIISSKHDTYTIARLINQSMPIKFLMKKKNLVTFSNDAYVEEVREVMRKQRHRDFPVLNKRGKYVGMISRRNLIGSRRKQLILVDHNEESQALDNVNEAEILEIIDHHRLGSLQTMAPVYFRNQPVGCTATILYQIYQEKGLSVEPVIAGLLCAAIISDTLMFRSPTCTPMDQAAAETLAKIAGIKIEKFATAMFQAGSNLKGKSAEEVFYQDFKKFIVEETAFGVGQISSMSAEDLQYVKKKLLPYMKQECQNHKLQMIFFMLTNILEESTELLYFGEEAQEVIESAFPVKAEDGCCVLAGVVSRKKQLIPAFMSAMQNQDGA